MVSVTIAASLETQDDDTDVPTKFVFAIMPAIPLVTFATSEVVVDFTKLVPHPTVLTAGLATRTLRFAARNVL